jgi:3-hydroxyacyl-CoA dehydrogenase/enoyl-CoA hydratase/3-hydroxybutyryl-CoA epimerase/enoyl-CoA isomerase
VGSPKLYVTPTPNEVVDLAIVSDLILPSHLKTPGGRNVAALIEFNERRIGARYGSAETRPILSVGVVGSGTMGASIAAATIRMGLPVMVSDTRPEALQTLPARVEAELADGAASPPAGLSVSAGSLLHPTEDVGAAARCDLVIETVVEDLFVKDRVLADLEPRLAAATVLGSNTSTISIGRLAARLADPARFCGIHFFLPVSRRPLVEVVLGPQSGPAAVATAVAFGHALGKIPLVVPDSPGFVVNRLMLLYLSEALQLLADGASIEQVEQAAADFGMRLGPLALIDQIGLDVALDCGWVLAGKLGESLVPSPSLVAMVKAGRLGRKSASGFFSYRDDGGRLVAAGPDPAVREILARWARTPQEHTPESITARLVLPMLLEATRLLAEGRIDDPRDIDLAVVFGFGFPADRGGLLYWADTLGVGRIVEMLGPLEGLGTRAQPTPFLMDMAAAGRRFYAAEGDRGS